MDLNAIAARIAAQCSGKCSQCGGDLTTAESADPKCAACAGRHVGPHSPAAVLAASHREARRSGVLRPEAEYSVNVELALTADFEGTSSKSKLLKKLQSELFAAVKESVATTAKELGLQSTGVVLKPIEVGVAVTDLSAPGDDEEPDDYEEPEAPRRRRRR